jgi:hypothetical protein
VINPAERGFALIRRFALLAAISAIALATAGQDANQKHTITLQFNYDFRLTQACSEKVTKDCVQQFIAYDISAGVANRTKLAVIPVPENAEGFVKGIAAKTPPLLFESGKHLLAVSAQMPNGKESNPILCTAWVQVP